ncbi:hypothetical protein PFISCL1PPCAC_12699, partial [Pristionchus fissidentatus]
GETSPIAAQHHGFFHYKSFRFWMGLLLMFALFSAINMRINLSMSMVCMVNRTAYEPKAPADNQSINTTNKCGRRAGSALKGKGYNGEILWSPEKQSQLLAATFFGMILTGFWSGTLADKIGPKSVLSVTLMVYILLTFMSPFLATRSYEGFYALRVIIGAAEGFLGPSLGSMAGKWSTANEKSSMAAVYTSGNQLANSLTHIINTALCESQFRWPAVFYLSGIIGIVWLITWQCFATNYPEDDCCVGEGEKAYLEEHSPSLKTQVYRAVPWRAIFTSPPVYAILACQFAFSFTLAIFMSFLPQYLRDVLMLPLDQNGYYMAICFVSQLVSKNVLAVVADRLKRSGRMGHTKCAKMFQTICCAGDAVTLTLLAIFGSCERPWLAGILLALYGAFFSAGICGFFTAFLSIAPRYTGTLTSLAGHETVWMIVFAAGAACNAIAGVIFLVFGSAEVQPWGRRDDCASSSSSKSSISTTSVSEKTAVR